MKLWAAAFAILAMMTSNSVRAADGGEDAQDMLCGSAPKGTVIGLPVSVSEWVTILCTPSGQALAPNASDKLVLWMTRSGSPFMLEAVPRDWKRPDNISKYDMRFTKFMASELGEEGRSLFLKLWDQSFAPATRPQIDRIVRLDAVSVWQGAVYNLFFYVVADRPKWLIVCSMQCERTLALNVVEPPGKTGG